MNDDLARFANGAGASVSGFTTTRIGAHVGHAQALLLGASGGLECEGAARLSEAIAFDKFETELVEQFLRHRLWHRGTAAADVLQAAQVVPRHVGAGQQVDHHGQVPWSRT